MLMITVETEAAGVVLRLDGRLAGPAVSELERNWHAAAVRLPHRRVLVDLKGVISVDGRGREFLAHVHRRGDTLVAGTTTRALVDEITSERPANPDVDRAPVHPER
jgi:anti-anti-sigma regulatory factor